MLMQASLKHSWCSPRPKGWRPEVSQTGHLLSQSPSLTFFVIVKTCHLFLPSQIDLHSSVTFGEEDHTVLETSVFLFLDLYKECCTAYVVFLQLLTCPCHFFVVTFRWSVLFVQGRLGLCDSEGHGAANEAESEANAIYGRLVHLDPMRSGFYKDALAGKAFVVVSALGRG